MRVPSALLLVAIAGFAAVQVVRRPSAPASGERADPAPPVARLQDSIRNAARVESLREARTNELRRAMDGPTTTFQPEDRPAQPTPRTYTEEELAHCSALPMYGPDGNVVGYSANPDCEEYRRRVASPEPRGNISAPFSSPIPR
jgi:hypothetical protein